MLSSDLFEEAFRDLFTFMTPEQLRELKNPDSSDSIIQTEASSGKTIKQGCDISQHAEKRDNVGSHADEYDDLSEEEKRQRDGLLINWTANNEDFNKKLQERHSYTMKRIFILILNARDLLAKDVSYFHVQTFTYVTVENLNHIYLALNSIFDNHGDFTNHLEIFVVCVDVVKRMDKFKFAQKLYIEQHDNNRMNAKQEKSSIGYYTAYNRYTFSIAATIK